MIRSTLKSLILAGAVCGALASAVAAAPNPPANGYPVNQDIGAIITNTARTPATVTGTPATPNTNWRGVVCSFKVTASSGASTETWSIEGYDAATANWYTIATTAAIPVNPNVAAPTGTIAVYPGVAVGSLSSGNVAQSAVLTRTWRLKDVVANVSGGPTVTSKGGCNYIN